MKARGYFVAFLLGGLFHGALFAQLTVQWKGEFPEGIQESSGLLLVGEHWVTINDSGNTPDLFVLDTTSLRLVRRVTVTNAGNTDWEDLAQDGDYIYIADIGNNLGARRDLRILRVSKSDFLSADALEAEIISFAYEGQTDFSGTANSDWDAEALLVAGDFLWIFTKQWQGQGTAAFRLPKTPGSHLATRVADYAAGGLVTGATPIQGGNGFLLLGYSTRLQPFLIHVPAASPAGGFPGATERLQPDWGFAQAEGIAEGALGKIFVSTERFSSPLGTLPAGLFLIDLGKGSPPVDSPPDPPKEDGGPGSNPGETTPGGELVIYGPAGSGLLRYELGAGSPVMAQAVFDTAGRLVLLEQGRGVVPGQVDVSALGRAVYYLTVFLPDQRLSKPFVRY
ncbi:hypothetical protein [Robiginitalea marina]|uniref:Secretion system C-terminal sorting domain-containing protein n=1 Tax=Robiginitalea marina TaxID=2954105 RepID=A0ABT1AV13_9FLAO|nr:hypothetical protein [Robiginitalea marina]MCO5723380.1 hypothetical protein [Robiginitalea marina]